MVNKVSDTSNKSVEKCKCDCGCCNDMCKLYGRFAKRYHKVHPIFATIVFIVVIAAGFGILAVVAKNQSSDIANLRTQVSQLESTVTTVTTNDVRANGVSYDGKNDVTALDLLKKSHKVETKEFSGMGEFVTSIDGVKAEDGKNFWGFYVNGTMAAEGAGTYKTKDGEKIEWRLEQIQ